MTAPWSTEEILVCEQGETPAPVATPDDSALVERVRKSYVFGKNVSGRKEDHDSPGTWKYIFDQRLLEVDEILSSDDFPRISNLLRDPASSNHFYGFDDLIEEYVTTRPKTYVEETSKVSLHRFAELMGFLRVFSPEAKDLYAVAPWLAKPQLTPDGFLESLEQALGVSIALPNIYRAEAGFITKKGVFSWRSLHALYAAVRINSLLGCVKGKKVLEIGAGLARTAYFGHMLGASRYDVVDIPTTAAAQGYFLGRTLGADSVRLQGEDWAAFPNAKVGLLAPSEFLASTDRYDIILNMDSFTEIPAEQAQTYADHMVHLTSRFLSINHEANHLVVADLFNGKAGVTRHRSAYLLRPGYMEDEYSISARSH